jgi:hypothetical protein
VLSAQIANLFGHGIQGYRTQRRVKIICPEKMPPAQNTHPIANTFGIWGSEPIIGIADLCAQTSKNYIVL